MTNLLRTAKSGSDWGRRELRAYNIVVEYQDATTFFGVDPLPQPPVAAEILHNVAAEVTADEGNYSLLRYMDLAMNLVPAQEVARSRVDIPLFICGEQHHAKTDVYPEPQLIAEAIAASQANNDKRTRILGQDPIAHKIMPGITMTGTSPVFYKIPVTTELADSVSMGQYPPTRTVVHAHLPPVLRPARRLSEGFSKFVSQKSFLSTLDMSYGVWPQANLPPEAERLPYLWGVGSSGPLLIQVLDQPASFTCVKFLTMGNCFSETFGEPILVAIPQMQSPENLLWGMFDADIPINPNILRDPPRSETKGEIIIREFFGATLHRSFCFLTITMMVGILAFFLLAISTTALAFSNESDLAVDTPCTLVQCNDTLLKWSGGFCPVISAPYYVLYNHLTSNSMTNYLLLHSIVPGSDPDGPILEDLGQQDDTNVTWTVNLSAGTSVIIAIRDSEAVSIQSDVVQIRNGTNSTCLNE
ncbi:uncharacterized protein EV420DRAFT_1761604 [Desarmillaria tabescens]|uniref:Uncharacterized protein n=1 Tax=Armillaria tabescens TaxID=1929756 RepID=A0AA39NB40_ARMTA|nr:uncharacterized protein EV420DRAFT_1761604 [Desarmillaria tabescens]KAK0462365.1 hypothetical protein EV420DRAFT_1761604 [Desarmillaria tabescens]